jgi:hypothetical protein
LLHLFIILVARGMRWESWFKVHVDGECPETDSEVRLLFDTKKRLGQYISE